MCENVPISATIAASGFSVERLLHFLTTLDRDLETTIRPKTPGSAGSTNSHHSCLIRSWTP